MTRLRSKLRSLSLKEGKQPPEGYVSPLLDERQYTVQCVGYKTAPYLGRSLKLYLYFDLTLSGKEDVFLFKVMNFDYDPFPQGSEYFNAWVLCHGQRPSSSKRSQMSPNIFLNKVMNVSVKTVIPSFNDHKPKPNQFHYSKVDQILSINT